MTILLCVCRSRWCSDDFPSDFRDTTDKAGGTGDGETDEFGEEKGKKKKKLVHCPHCTRTFTHRNSLLYHVRSYSGRRLHQCDVCGKGFFAANALRVRNYKYFNANDFK